MKWIVGEYYRLRGQLWKAEECTFCPSNIHRVREGCRHPNKMMLLKVVRYIGYVDLPYTGCMNSHYPEIVKRASKKEILNFLLQSL